MLVSGLVQLFEVVAQGNRVELVLTLFHLVVHLVSSNFDRRLLGTDFLDVLLLELEVTLFFLGALVDHVIFLSEGLQGV